VVVAKQSVPLSATLVVAGSGDRDQRKLFFHFWQEYRDGVVKIPHLDEFLRASLILREYML
jgi:hypothetical protein